MLCGSASATIYGVGALYSCADGGWGVRSITAAGAGGYQVCAFMNQDSGDMGFGAGQSFGSITSQIPSWTVSAYWLNAYPPFTGVYRAGVALCPGRTRCTLKRAAIVLRGLWSFKLQSNISISSQDVTSGGLTNYTITMPHSACSVLIDSSGVYWSSPTDPATCSDGTALPQTPADCTINNGDSLNVALGTLERGSISTAPASGSPGNLKRDIPVLCTRDAGTTVSTTFKYTPVTFNGYEVISTNSNGLGVAVFYKGRVVGPSSAPIIETFASGYTNREFEFQAVRDPAIALKDIPTGNFSASATMIMTQQ